MADCPASKPRQILDEAELVSLVQAIVARNEAALARLYDLTVGRVYSLAYALTRNSADAEEVVCDVYLRVWQRAAQYQESRGKVLAWLLINCRSLALDLLRRRRRQEAGREQLALQEAVEADAAASTEDLLALVQEGTRVHRALSALSDIQRQLIALAFFSDMSHQAIAATVQLPLGTVKSHIRRSLKVLRVYLQ